MTRRLKTFVHVGGNAYGPDDEVPAEVAERIGDHAWQDDSEAPGEDEPEAVGFTDPRTSQQQTVEAPPRSGRGSGIEAWLAFAEAQGVGTDSDMNRDDVIAACEAAGVVEPEQPKE
ncbi:hypothetical protein [Streptomyces pseudovenezuelae]|uniref:hypothetical protein n=1 Tax=Streptomyces pseudovenezuelae TaxID=67350 RepID=UPI0036F0E694